MNHHKTPHFPEKNYPDGQFVRVLKKMAIIRIGVIPDAYDQADFLSGERL